MPFPNIVFVDTWSCNFLSIANLSRGSKKWIPSGASSIITEQHSTAMSSCLAEIKS